MDFREIIKRKIPCNSVKEVRMLVAICNKVIDNLVSQPENKKFSTLRWDNKMVNNRIISVNGGLEILKMLGFRKKRRNGQITLEKKEVDCLQLLASKQWLSEQVATVLFQLADQCPDTPCASYMLQFYMPNGARHTASFDPSTETVGEALNFARLLLSGSQRNRNVAFRRPFVKDLMTEEDGEITLEHAGIASNTTMVVVHVLEPQDSSSTIQAAEASTVEQVFVQAKASQERFLSNRQMEFEMQSLNLQKKKLSEKERLVQQFQDDRQKLKGRRTDSKHSVEEEEKTHLRSF